MQEGQQVNIPKIITYVLIGLCIYTGVLDLLYEHYGLACVMVICLGVNVYTLQRWR